MDNNQANKVIELLELNNNLLEAIGRMMLEESEANSALVDQLLNKPKKDPFAAFNNQKMVRAAQDFVDQ